MGQYFNPSTKGTITGFTLDFYSDNAAEYYPLPVKAEMEKSRLQLLTGGLPASAETEIHARPHTQNDSYSSDNGVPGALLLYRRCCRQRG
jgi:hypothetical protein